ncbi:TolC family outer membrane protein [Paenochrobactrum sp. BZR 588]|uniref:TolC family outer membrane protein n=1 Tax=Paenochrobactrum TaxID=999488 RepID=UPI0035BC05C2
MRFTVHKARKNILTAALLAGSVLMSGSAWSDTLTGALTKAYHNNAKLNSARAGLRATDEGVAVAKSGYRPTVNGSYNVARSRSHNSLGNTYATVGKVGVELNQMLFDGFQTQNKVAFAESMVFATREKLKNEEMNSLYGAVTVYMDVYQARQIAALYERNLAAMNEQVRAARARLDVGEGTRTDVAQAEASRANAVASLNAAKANVKSAEAAYREVIGTEPDKLSAASPADKLLPRNPAASLAIANDTHPGILATQYAVDAAGYDVKSAEGALLPGVNLNAGASRTDTYAGGTNSSITDGNSASIGLGVTIPIYQGGRTSALVRQNKEKLGQARIEVDVIRDQVRQGIGSAWAQYEAAKANVVSTRTGISAAQLALEGVIEERNVGQRTTLDVLKAQNDLTDVQIAQVKAQHDLVVASYAILNASGRMTARHLSLQVAEYKPEQHYEAVKDKWIGLRTPDGR